MEKNFHGNGIMQVAEAESTGKALKQNSKLPSAFHRLGEDARVGTPIHVTEKLLNHVSGTLSGVTARYNRYSYLAEMRDTLKGQDNFPAKLLVEKDTVMTG